MGNRFSTWRAKDEQKQRARLALGINTNKYNIAFAGVSVVGKSTLINTLIRKKKSDIGAARVGRTQTTHDIRRYSMNEHTDIWDLPGCGTRAHPTDKYFVDKSLYVFDAVFIMYHDHIDWHMTILADFLRHWGCEVIFLKTKADLTLGDYLEDHEHAIESEVIQAVQQEIFDDFQEQMGHERLFIISARNLNKQIMQFDEIRLIDYITQQAKKRVNRSSVYWTT